MSTFRDKEAKRRPVITDDDVSIIYAQASTAVGGNEVGAHALPKEVSNNLHALIRAQLEIDIGDAAARPAAERSVEHALEAAKAAIKKHRSHLHISGPESSMKAMRESDANSLIDRFASAIPQTTKFIEMSVRAHSGARGHTG